MNLYTNLFQTDQLCTSLKAVVLTDSILLTCLHCQVFPRIPSFVLSILSVNLCMISSGLRLFLSNILAYIWIWGLCTTIDWVCNFTFFHQTFNGPDQLLLFVRLSAGKQMTARRVNNNTACARVVTRQKEDIITARNFRDEEASAIRFLPSSRLSFCLSF